MAIVRIPLDEMMDEAMAMPQLTRERILEMVRSSPTEEDVYDPDCPPLTAEQLSRAVPLRVANPKMYAEIEAARERAIKRKAQRERQTRDDNANYDKESVPQKESEVCFV